ncbi:MAG: hypothetical protein ABGX25_00610 [Nautiliaceae bacterium]
MNLIHNISWINQNSHIPSVIMADHVAREIVSREVQKIINEEKELKVNEVRPVEEIEKILPEDDEKEDVEREVKHIDLKA